LDVLIVGRGGGSLEELWCFNEEIVARAIARSAIPVISAVGHEIDFTISDFVADVRAPTPSSAAELVVGCKEDFEARLGECRRRLRQALQASVEQAHYRFDRARASYVFREPSHLLQLARQRIQERRQRMRQSLLGRWREWQQHNDELRSRLIREMHAWHGRRVQDVSGYASQLRALSPLAVLARGFSLTRDTNGAILRSTAQVRPGSQVTTHLAQGAFDSEVRRIHEQKEE
jgi:exodeoxyribonuclease VII large subunit